MALLSFMAGATAACAGTETPPQEPLALYRLSQQQITALRTAARVQITLAVKRVKYAPPEQETVFTAKAPERSFADALNAILMDDHTYTAIYDGHRSLPEAMLRMDCSLYVLGANKPALNVEIYPDIQEMYVVSPAAPGSGYRPGYLINYMRVAPRVLALVKQAFPDVAQIQALKAEPLRVSTVLPAIPPDVLKVTAKVRVGMTRADLLKVYKEMGGLSTTYERTYYMDGVSVPPRIMEEVNVNGVKVRQLSRMQSIVRVDARFAPRKVRLRWVGGAGIVIDPAKMYEMRSDERPDDIIVHLSAPYLGGYVGD